jgi:hypothetical protein
MIITEINRAEFDSVPPHKTETGRGLAAFQAAGRKAGDKALAGSVAAAVRYLSKALMVNDPALGKIVPSAHAIVKARESLTADGIGKRTIVDLLRDVPGMNEGVAQQQLANLKSSTDYAAGKMLDRKARKTSARAAI